MVGLENVAGAFFDKDLSSEESIKVNAYLAEKWGLSIDSDGDGIKDVFILINRPKQVDGYASVLRQSSSDFYMIVNWNFGMMPQILMVIII